MRRQRTSLVGRSFGIMLLLAAGLVTPTGASLARQTVDNSALPAGEVPCYGNGTDGSRVEVIYAVATDKPDRYAEAAPFLRDHAWKMDLTVIASARATSGVRHIRFVTDANCDLVVHHLVLSPSGDENYNTVVAELKAKGFDRSDRKYLAFVENSVLCGQASGYEDDSSGPQNAHTGANGEAGYAFLPSAFTTNPDGSKDAGCWGAALHELWHTLGAVQLSAPNYNPSAYKHCSDGPDPMCKDPGQTIVCESGADDAYLLDCNNDDYFHTNPLAGSYLDTHLNTADSPFLSADRPTNAVDATTPTGQPCTIVGTEGPDNIEGTQDPDVICTLGGNDLVVGSAKNDVVDGGTGKDTYLPFSFANGMTLDLSDQVTNGIESGYAQTFFGRVTLFGIENAGGTKGIDSIYGTERANSLDGGAGDDQILGLGGKDRLLGGDGNDTLRGGNGNDFLDAGLGDSDRLYGAKGTDECILHSSTQQTFKC